MGISPQRRAIVTGAASGLGRAIALRLARDGWWIALADVNPAGCERVLAEVRSAGGSGRVETLDVRVPEEWAALRERIEADGASLDLLVNNAGVAGSGLVGQFSAEDWDWLLSINLHGVIHGCQTFVEVLKANPRGAHLMNVASLAGFLSAPAMGAYNVSKAGVIALSETLCAELAPHRVTVNVLCPGFFATNLLDGGRFATEALRRGAHQWMDAARLTADRVADAAVRSIGKRRLYVIEGARARWLWRLKRWFPRTFHVALLGHVGKAIAEEERAAVAASMKTVVGQNDER